MRVVYMGTGDIAIPSFKALQESSCELVALVTQPDKPVGRKQVLTAPQIKIKAQQAGIPVFQPEKVKDTAFLTLLDDLKADVIVVMAYGQILPQALLDLPKHACINLHASLLPKHRGASCIQAAIAQGDEETGMTIMHVSLGLDEGDVLLRHSTLIKENETGGLLHDRLALMGPAALMEAMDMIAKGEAKGVPQDDDLADYAPKLLRKHGLIDWSRPASELERLIRAYDPWPGTYSTYLDAKDRERRLKIFPQTEVVKQSGSMGEVLSVSSESFIVACGEDALRIMEVQPEGGKVMEAGRFLASGVIDKGSVLGALVRS